MNRQPFELEEQQEKAVLAGLHLPEQSKEESESSFRELANLAETAGARVVAQLMQSRPKPDPSTYIGSGKLRELEGLIKHYDVDMVIFDSELTPVQTRNLENALDVKVIDRTRLILDIFALRARSKEGMLQVDLAQLQYTLPRLTGKGVELSRQGGGIGTRGAGEKKLELDRRRIRDKIADLKRELETVKKQRKLSRARREKTGIPLVSIVGYTNAGKSTLFNAVYQHTRQENANPVEAEDKLFATLSTTTRQIRLPSGRETLMTDTVGFIQNLPHHLVAAFKSTLEEAVEADIMIHVVDTSPPDHHQQMKTVEQVLHDLGAEDIPIITVYNKIDRLDPETRSALAPLPDTIYLSARSGEGIDRLLLAVDDLLKQSMSVYHFRIPYTRPQLMSKLYESGEVIESREEETGWDMTVRMSREAYGRIQQAMQSEI
ncbi:MAG: GTPase HflX [Bacillaceae bacterium]|nr:GTPase HflX [Bacillaceae bacterium]